MICLVAFIIINVGLAGFQANIIQFGIDQMVDASVWRSNECLHSLVLLEFGSESDFEHCAPCTALHQHTLCCTDWNQCSLQYIECCTAVLVQAEEMKRWFIIEPQCQNPFKTVYDVIKFASSTIAPSTMVP